jgi:SAM-dependent methyltransferase
MPRPPPFPRREAPRPRRAGTAWEQQAAWYDRHQGEGGDDFYQQLILPCVLARLAARPGQVVLDVGCGQGVLGRALAERGVRSLGVDASPAMIVAAKARAGERERHQVADARRLREEVAERGFDHAALVMVLQDLDPVAPVLDGVAGLVKARGRLVVVLSHPCFRIPKRSSWGWDGEAGLQYRRLDAYLSRCAVPIRTHPGRPDDGSATSSFHRPVSDLVNAIGEAGFGVIACDELCSHRRGTKGARYAAEDRAAREFPLFLVFTAQRL